MVRNGTIITCEHVWYANEKPGNNNFNSIGAKREEGYKCPNVKGVLGWRENGRGKKMGGEKMERKENGRENVIPHHAWLDEGKLKGRKMNE